MKRFAAAICAAVALVPAALAEQPADPRIERGKYLVTIMSCTDCHTPGYFYGKPDMARYLGGTDVGFALPGLGYFYGPNLTPDKATGLGEWSEDQIVTALRTGERPDGRILAPVMPYMAFATLTDDDAYAIAAFLKTLPEVDHKAPPPTGWGEAPPAPYQAVTMPPGQSDPSFTARFRWKTIQK